MSGGKKFGKKLQFTITYRWCDKTMRLPGVRGYAFTLWFREVTDNVLVWNEMTSNQQMLTPGTGNIIRYCPMLHL